MLIASRRRLAALEDAAVISLDTLIPGEPAELIARLAAPACKPPPLWVRLPACAAICRWRPGCWPVSLAAGDCPCMPH